MRCSLQAVAFTAIAIREELKKFFIVALARQQRGEKTGMPSCYLDTFWHRIAENPKQYEQFCLEFVGTHALVDHLPYNGEGILEWVPEYEAQFGLLPSIWFTDLDGKVNVPMYDEYMETGTVRASWNCGPALPPKESGEVRNAMMCV